MLERLGAQAGLRARTRRMSQRRQPRRLDFARQLVHAIFMSFFLSFFSTPVLAAVIATQTVGQAGGQVITSREVQISMVIEDVLYPQANAKPLAVLRTEDVAFKHAVTAVLLESVVAMEAESFNVGTVTDMEMKNALEKVNNAVAGKVFWTNLEVSNSELKRFTSRKLISKNFLRFKTNSLAGIITDQEAQTYYEQNRVKFGEHNFASFKDNIKSYLAQQQLEDRLRTWFEVIKKKYKVKNLAVQKNEN
jgi:hypothetical protein